MKYFHNTVLVWILPPFWSTYTITPNDSSYTFILESGCQSLHRPTPPYHIHPHIIIIFFLICLYIFFSFKYSSILLIFFLESPFRRSSSALSLLYFFLIFNSTLHSPKKCRTVSAHDLHWGHTDLRLPSNIYECVILVCPTAILIKIIDSELRAIKLFSNMEYIENLLLENCIKRKLCKCFTLY